MGVNYNPGIVTDGLVGCWDVASARSSPGGGTTWTDLSKNGNDGTLTNGPTIRTSHGGSVKFDGTDDYINLGSSTLVDTDSAFTVMFWVRHSSHNDRCNTIRIKGTSEFMVTFGKDGNTTVGGRSAYLGFRGYQSTSTTDVNCFTDNNTHIWQHYAVTFNGGAKGTLSSFKLYRNATPITLSQFSNTIGGSANSNEFGRDGSSGGELGGFISLVQLYNRELSESEIKQNYNATKGRFDTPSIVTDSLVLHLDAGDSNSYPGTGTTWTDLSGEGNNGTLVNGPTFSSSDGGEIVLDSTNDYITVPEISLGTDPFSVEMWAKPDSHIAGYGGNGEWHMFGNMANNNTWAAGWVLEWNTWSADGPSFWINNNNTENLTLGLDVRWYHVVGVRNGTSGWIYVDGILVASRTGVSSFGTTVDFGNDITIGGAYRGTIATARIYNRDLTATEVIQNYRALQGRFV